MAVLFIFDPANITLEQCGPKIETRGNDREGDKGPSHPKNAEVEKMFLRAISARRLGLHNRPAALLPVVFI
jgi:hypothetical protein